MIDIERLEKIYDKCGGVFKATVLIQKRIRELNRGGRRLVDGEFRNPIEIALREIEEGKIYLVEDTEENRDRIRRVSEKISGTSQQPQVEVALTTGEDELERRIMSALQKERQATSKSST